MNELFVILISGRQVVNIFLLGFKSTCTHLDTPVKRSSAFSREGDTCLLLVFHLLMMSCVL